MPAPVNTGWTEARVARLLELDAERVSASAIARELGGGITRNSVIGKLHRLKRDGLRPERPPVPAKVAARPPGGLAAPAVAPPAPPPVFVEEPPVERDDVRPTCDGVALDQLRDLEASCRLCRYILGPVRGPSETRYCGARTTEPGAPYCGEHTGLCWQRRAA